MGGVIGGRSQRRAQEAAGRRNEARLAKVDARQAEQERLIKEREARTKKVEDAQRRVRSGRRRGLLAFTEDESDNDNGRLSAFASSVRSQIRG